jgi:hypothetical protein
MTDSPEQGIQRNRITERVPHPSNGQTPNAAERGMEGVLRVRARAARAGGLLPRWNVDCIGDHRLMGGQQPLWLRNRPALYGVSGLALAPGYGTVAHF